MAPRACPSRARPILGRPSLARPSLGGWACAALTLWAAGCGQPRLLEVIDPPLRIDAAAPRLIRITEDGLRPAARVTLQGGARGVAFLNDTRADVLTLILPEVLPEVRDRPDRRSSGDFVVRGGATVSARPLAPGGLVRLPLRSPGRHVFEVHGLGAPPLRGALFVRGPRQEP